MSGFPTIIRIVEELDEILDEITEQRLISKRNPAVKAADVIKKETKRRREIETQLRRMKVLTELYEQLVPSLAELREETIPPEDEWILEDYSEEEQSDKVTEFLTKEEYRKLSQSERNQMALDRFWQRPKSKWRIGMLYERYVGYLYEKEGYLVEYYGIKEGLFDLGRDLVCTKGDEIIIVQCKNWSSFKTIHEKHIFQLFGTVFQFRDKFKKKNVKAVFYTTTKLSELSRSFANELDIDVVENHIFDQNYPSIKCNISSSKEKIYHLPFDQQYDKVQIETHKGECYCRTISEAERLGFRRAFRWKGTNKVS